MRTPRITPKTVPLESFPLSDKGKLLWERYFTPMQAAAATFNTAIKNTEQLLASILLEIDGYSPETHVFDMDHLRIIKRPAVAGDNGATK